MNPYETPPSAVTAKNPDLLERATRLRGFCGKLAYFGVCLALGSLFICFGATHIPGQPLLVGIAGIGVLLGLVTAVAAVAWAWVAIFLEFIGRSWSRRRSSSS